MKVQRQPGRGEGGKRSGRPVGVFSPAESGLFLRPKISVTTEITDDMDTRPRSGWIFYDGDCTVCLELAARFGGLLHGAGFELVPFQHPWAVATLDLASGEIPDAARVVTTDGASSAGVDAMLFLAGCFWWAKPVAWLGRWPAAMRWMRRGYAWFAARRHCIGGVCGLPRPGQRPAEASTLNQRREAQ